MKAIKFICVFMCAILAFVKPAFAQQEKTEFVLPSSFVKANETFFVTLNINSNNSFSAHSFKIEFDNTAVSLVTSENCNVISDGVAKAVFSYLSTNSISTQLEFKVLSQKDVVFKVSEITVSDGNEEYYFDDISATFNNGEILKGDLDLNGEIDVVDLALLKKEVAGINQVNNEYISDYDSNGIVDVVDLALLKKRVAGIR